jgi:hypothetical protein
VLLVVCGMHRSGSTLVWQITRMLLEDQPALRNPRGLATDEFRGAAEDPADVLMAKVHFRTAMKREDFPDEGAKYLYTFRDPRDVVASLYRKGRLKQGHPDRGARNSRLTVRRELRGDAFWRGKSQVWIRRYEDFKDDVPGLVRDLASYLDVAVDDQRVAAIVEEVDLQAQAERALQAKRHGVDENLRITSNHITDGREGAWRDTLTDEELVAIEGEGAVWLNTHGYAVETAVGRRKIAPKKTPQDRARAAEERRRERAARLAAEARAAGRGALPWAGGAGVLLIAGGLITSRQWAIGASMMVAGALAGAWGAYRLGQHKVPLRRVARTMLADIGLLRPRT